MFLLFEFIYKEWKKRGMTGSAVQRKFGINSEAIA